MRARWKLLGGAGLIGIGIAFFIGRGGVSRGDTTSPTTPSRTATIHDPFKPWDLGPGVILYDQLSATDKAGVDQIQQTVETGQPPPSHQVFSNAVDATIVAAQAQIAARAVGLVGAANQGVVP